MCRPPGSWCSPGLARGGARPKNRTRCSGRWKPGPIVKHGMAILPRRQRWRETAAIFCALPPKHMHGGEGSPVNISEIKPLGDSIRAQIAKAVVGQADTIELLLVALFAGGHILLEGPPGVA